MNQFQKAIQQPIICDICVKEMVPVHGGGWDNGRINGWHPHSLSPREMIGIDIQQGVELPTHYCKINYPDNTP